MTKQISRSEFVAKVQPLLDLFDLDIVPTDVAEFGYVTSTGNGRHRNDALMVKVFSRGEGGFKTGTVTHERWFNAVGDQTEF